MFAICATVSPALAHPDPSIIRGHIRAKMPAFRACYEQALQKDPKLEGKVVARFTILKTGEVVDTTATGIPEINACIVRVVRSVRFPSNPRGSMVVSYPFVFVPR